MQRNWFIVAFITFWLGGWTYGGLQVLNQLLRHFELFSAFWMGGWLLGEVFVTIWLLRMLGGRDILVATNDRLEIRKEVFGIGTSKQYLRSDIRDLRFQPEVGAGRGHRESRIAFDYGAKTVTLGDGLDEAEANQLIASISEHCNFAKPRPSDGSAPRFWHSR
jgi:hypothetical protein